MSRRNIRHYERARSVPNPELVMTAVTQVIHGFDTISAMTIINPAVKELVIQIHQQNLNFRCITVQSVEYATIIDHCGEIVNHVRILTEGNVANEDFVEAIDSMGKRATQCQNTAQFLKNSYKSVQEMCDAIVTKLKNTRQKFRDREAAFSSASTQHEGSGEVEGTVRSFTRTSTQHEGSGEVEETVRSFTRIEAIGRVVGAFVSAMVVDSGINETSLAQRHETSLAQRHENVTENRELISDSITRIILQMHNIIKALKIFVKFWESEADYIKRLKARLCGQHLRVLQITSKVTIRKWTGVRRHFHTFEEIKHLLDNI